MWIEFVVDSGVARGFFSGFSGFLSSTKTNISKFQFDQDRGTTRKPAETGVASLIYDLPNRTRDRC